MHYSGARSKFEDCIQHGLGGGAELFIVEGDSAAGAVANLRNAQTQAVLPMQGKPLNALRTSGERVSEFSLFKQLVAALGVNLLDTEPGEASDLATLLFDRVLLLFDPDADGIHCGALMLMFFIVGSGRCCSRVRCRSCGHHCLCCRQRTQMTERASFPPRMPIRRITRAGSLRTLSGAV